MLFKLHQTIIKNIYAYNRFLRAMYGFIKRFCDKQYLCNVCCLTIFPVFQLFLYNPLPERL